MVSPIINTDNSVTFQVKAPDAEILSVSCSLDAEKAFASIAYEMEKGEEGIWSFTTPSLPSDFYRYYFIIDGASTTDPENAFAIRDVGNLSSVFLISGG